MSEYTPATHTLLLSTAGRSWRGTSVGTTSGLDLNTHE